MVEQKNPGREGPDPQGEPREFDTHDTAHDPTPGTGQVSRNDSVLEPLVPNGVHLLSRRSPSVFTTRAGMSTLARGLGSLCWVVRPARPGPNGSARSL